MRLPVTKTPKFYSGGSFQRSESGRVRPLRGVGGELVGQIPVCSRKDLRNAVEAAAKAGASWAKRSPYNRGQILYRLAEMMESRALEIGASLAAVGGSASAVGKETSACIDRVVHYAGWADKYEQVLGSVNPVATPHFNFTVTEPVGVAGILAPDHPALLGLLSLVLPAITGGNSVVALVSAANPLPAILLGEMLATSDLPGGVVNLLTGDRAELVAAFAGHEQIRVLAAVLDQAGARELEAGAAESVKRVKWIPADGGHDWFSARAQGVYEIREFTEAKTTWHPAGW